MGRARSIIRRGLEVSRVAIANLHGRREWRRHVARHRSHGVRIDPAARVYGADEIEFGPRCALHHDTIIAATCMDPGDRPWSRPAGRVVLGRCCNVMPGAVIASYGGEVRLGDHVDVNPYAVLYGHGGLRIGDHSLIAAHVVAIPASHNFRERAGAVRGQGLSCLGIDIGSGVWLGAGVKVLDGVKIGDGAVVGAGAVVNRDIGAGEIVAGVPARQVGIRPGFDVEPSRHRVAA